MAKLKIFALHALVTPAATSSLAPKRRWRWWRIVGWCLLLLVVLLVLAAVALYVGHRYLVSDRLKTFDEVPMLNGGSVSFGPVRGLNLSTYPDFEVRVGEVYLSQHPRGTDSIELLNVGETTLRFTLDPWSDTLAVVHSLRLADADFYLLSDSSGRTNLSYLLHGDRTDARPTAVRNQSRFDDRTYLLADSFAVHFERMQVDWANPAKESRIGARIERGKVSDIVQDSGFAALLELDARVDGLQFKAREGPFLEDGTLRGQFAIERRNTQLLVEAPGLDISGNVIDFSAQYFPERDGTSQLTFKMPRTVLATARPLLSAKLQREIASYEVDGEFATVTRLFLPAERGLKPFVEIDVALNGNNARIDTERFGKAYARGLFVNRLPGVDSFGRDLRRGVRFEVDTVSTRYYGFDVTSGRAAVTAPLGGPTWLRAQVRAVGPSRAAGEALGTQSFLFSGGRVEVEGEVAGPLDNVNAIIDASDGRIEFEDVTVEVVASQTSLPLERVTVDKQGSTASFAVLGKLRTPGHSYRLEGEMTGIGTLLYGKYAVPTRTQVKLQANHLSWRDVVGLLGDDPMQTDGIADTTLAMLLVPDEDGLTAVHDLDPADETTADQVAGMKAALAQLQATFDPTVDLAIDTLTYYDASVYRLRSGLHFRSDRSVVLEQTTFLVDTATVRFGGSLNIGEARRTPFRYQLSAEHLDIDALLPQIDYLGQRFLREIETYPNDVSLHAEQEGYIDDEQGLLANTSTGSIKLVSNKMKAFEASIEFAPDDPLEPEKKGTQVQLRGSPSLFNEFFRTEDFFFRGGEFAFDMAYSGLVPDLRTLIDREQMSLRVNNTNVLLSSLGVTVPLTRLALDMDRDVAGLELLLYNETIDQEISVSGTALNVSEVALGETGKQFSTDVLVTSPRLVWNDLNTLIGELASDEPRDTTEALNIRSNVRALMRKFEPTVQVEIGELVLNRYVNIRNVSSGLHMDPNDRLFIDTTGFDYLDGEMEMAGYIDLRDLSSSPFDVHLSTEALDLAALLEGFEYFDMQSLANTKQLGGVLSMRLDTKGTVLGGDQPALLTSATQGTLDFTLRDLQVQGLSPIDSLAAKLRLRKRLDSLAFAPISNRIELHGDSVFVPLMEIQSNAFNVFVEGDYTLDGKTDMWVSVPLYNLKRPERGVLPEKRGWNDSRLKLHVDLVTGEEGLGTKLRLRKRKYYKRTGRLEEWRALRRR